MKTRTKIFGSIFIIAVCCIVAGVVLVTVGFGQQNIEDLMPETPQEFFEPLPDIDGSLSELPEFILPEIDLPDIIGTDLPEFDFEVPEVGVTAPEVGSLTTNMPPISFGPNDIQEMINQATETYGANVSGFLPTP